MEIEQHGPDIVPAAGTSRGVRRYAWVIISVGGLGLGALLFVLFGRFFIREAIQDVGMSHSALPAESDHAKPAPPFELPDLSGAPVKIGDALGKPVILTFFATWNSLSADQMKILDGLLRNGPQGLFGVLAIASQEDRSAVSNFIIRSGYAVRVLVDETGEVGARYQARTLPATYVIDANGAIRDTFVGVAPERELMERIERLLPR